MTAVPIPPERLHRSSRRWISAATSGSRDVTYVRGTMCVPLMVNLTVKKTLIQRNERSEEKAHILSLGVTRGSEGELDEEC